MPNQQFTNEEKEYYQGLNEAWQLYDNKKYIEAYQKCLELIDKYGRKEEFLAGLGWFAYYIGRKFEDLVKEENNKINLTEITNTQDLDMSRKIILENAEKYFRELLESAQSEDSLTPAYSGLPLVLCERHRLKLYNSDEEAQELLKEAERIVNEGLEKFKDAPNILNTKGLVEMYLGKYDESKKSYEKGLEIALEKKYWRSAGHNAFNLSRLLFDKIYKNEKDNDKKKSILQDAQKYANDAIEYYEMAQGAVKNIDEVNKLLESIKEELKNQ